MRKPSSGARKLLGMAVLYILVPLFVVWYAFFVLKLVKADFSDVLLFFAMIALLAFLYKKYAGKRPSQQEMREGLEGDEEGFSEESGGELEGQDGGAELQEGKEEAGVEGEGDEEEFPEDETEDGDLEGGRQKHASKKSRKGRNVEGEWGGGEMEKPRKQKKKPKRGKK